MRLTPMREKNKVKIKRCQTFGGCNFTPACGEGEFSSMSNLSARRFPALAPRQTHYVLNRQCVDFFIYDDVIYTVSGGSLYRNNKAAFTLATATSAKRSFSVVGKLLCIFPDKQYYNIDTKEYGSLEGRFTGKCSFGDGTRFSEPAENNTLTCNDVSFGSVFRVGDGVKITGSVNNDGYYIIREIDGGKLMFDENVFSPESDTESVTISRDVPLLEYSFECNNRLWGVYNNTIYASALGDPFNFNVFDGASTDSYYKEIYSSGEFTGGVSYGNTPVFFKEDMIYRIFGDMPTGFYAEMREVPGVTGGCNMSIANVNGALIYAGSDGIYMYDSAYPIKISKKLGDFRPGRGCAGSDGDKYYISMSNFSGVYPGLSQMLSALDDKKTYVYNMSTKSWHTVTTDNRIEKIMCGIYGSANSKPNTYALDASGKLFTLNDTISGTAEGLFFLNEYEVVESDGITGVWEFDGYARMRKAVISIDLPSESRFALDISFDGGDFINIGEIYGNDALTRAVFNVPRVRFASCRLRYQATGDFTLHWLELHYANSSRRDV